MSKGRGIFNSLLADNSADKNRNSKGRNKQLNTERDKCLLLRYYYYSKIQRLRFEDVSALLSSEFFLSERTIANIVSANHEELKKIFIAKPTISTLKENYDHLNWKNQPQ